MRYYPVFCNIDYFVPYIPPRCRKTRYEHKRETIRVSVRSVSSSDAPVAFRLSDYSHVSNKTTEVRHYAGKLYIKRRGYRDGSWYVDIPPSDLHFGPDVSYLTEERTRDACVSSCKDAARHYLLIDGVVWELTGEPRYVVNTFGLGHNHGGTGLFVDCWYNDNIPNSNYFSAIDGPRAVAYANEVAERRGDTNDVGRFHEMIEVVLPQCVKIKPMKEHGTGCPIINAFNDIANSSSSASEAGILALAFAACNSL